MHVQVYIYTHKHVYVYVLIYVLCVCVCVCMPGGISEARYPKIEAPARKGSSHSVYSSTKVQMQTQKKKYQQGAACSHSCAWAGWIFFFSYSHSCALAGRTLRRELLKITASFAHDVRRVPY